MRAINLVPADQREGGLSGGRSGGMVYGLLGALGVLLIAVAVLVSASKNEKESVQQLAGIEQVTQQYATAAAQYGAIEKAATEAKARIAAVEGLADARFDWAGAMRDLSRVIPKTTQVQALSASVRATSGSQTTSSMLRGGLDTPAITLQGCSVSQDSVADLLGRLQAMRRVTQVSLESSTRDTSAGTTNCTVKANGAYTFVLVVFYAVGNTVAAADATAGEVVAATTPATETTGTATSTSTAGN